MRILIIALLGHTAISLYAQNPVDFFSTQEIADANTAKDVTYLSIEEKEIFLYNNLARMQPQKFHKFYVAYCAETERSDMLHSDHYYKTLSTDLQNRRPAGPLLPDRKMFELAECWAVESGAKGILGHDRLTCPTGYGGENCAYGTKTGKEIVLQLLIDFGVPSLGHRTNMLNPRWKGLGTAIRPHKSYRVCAVQNFTSTNDILRAKAEKEAKEREMARKERERLLAIRAAELEARIQKSGNLSSAFSADELANADVGRSLSYLNDFEKDFYFYLNLARMYPEKFKREILEEGPYFDRFKEEQEDIRSGADYLRLAKHLQLSVAKPAFVPKKEYMDAGRCVVKKWRSGANSTSCLPGPGGWRLQTYYSENTHSDIIGFLLNPKDFEDIFKKNAHVIVVEGDGQTVKVFLR